MGIAVHRETGEHVIFVEVNRPGKYMFLLDRARKIGKELIDLADEAEKMNANKTPSPSSRLQ